MFSNFSSIDLTSSSDFTYIAVPLPPQFSQQSKSERDIEKEQKSQRRIQKKKQKLLVQFNRSANSNSNSNTNNDEVVNNQNNELQMIVYNDKTNDNLASQNHNKQLAFRRCRAKLIMPIHINSIEYYLFTGFVSIEMPPKNEYNDTKPYMRMKIIEKRPGYYSIAPTDVEFSSNFDQAIYLLEAQRDMQQFIQAQNLKIYKRITERNNETLKRIKAHYANSIPALKELQMKRKAFRDASIQKRLNELSEGDGFFVSCDTAVNFLEAKTCPSNMTWSCNSLMLFGVDPHMVDSFIVRNDSLHNIIPYNSRHRIMMAMLDLRANLEERGKDRVLIQGLKLVTIDEIEVICDVTAELLLIPFPKQLSFPEEFVLSKDIESFMIFEFNVTSYVLNQIILQRDQRMKNSNSSGGYYPEDVEYSVLSQLFLEKYYLEELSEMFPDQYKSMLEKKKLNCPKKISPEEQKTQCGYRNIL